MHVFWGERQPPIFVVQAALAAQIPFLKGGALRAPLFGSDFPAAGAAQIPQIADLSVGPKAMY